MIPYAELEKAIGRWKARKAAREEGTPPPQLMQQADGGAGGEKRKLKSSLDWSMDQAMGSSPPPTPSSGDTSEIPLDAISEEADTNDLPDASSAPSAETSGDSTGEIDVNDIVDDGDDPPR